MSLTLPTSLSSSSVESGGSYQMRSNYLDFPPAELLAKPMPLVVLTGLDSTHNPAHKAIAEILVNDRKSDRLPINYIVRPVDYEYPKAKPKKSSYEWYVPRGILKMYWMRKHLTELPAVVVLFYNLDWIQDPQWREKQGECQSLVRTIQSSLAGRSTKIVLVVIQEGAALPPGGDAISEERCGLLCAACGLQLQSSLFILQNNEQLQGCCIKLESRLFELAQNYYVMETRNVKEHREFLNKTTHQLLFVRHHFKIGFLSEFVRPPDGIQAALRNYRQAFGHLMDVRATDYNLHEIKTVAGFISYKIWALSLLPGSNASQRDAELHFRKHVDWLRPRVGQPELAFEHYAWLASQYRMFADLFAEACRSGGFTASISQHPGVYYHNAAVLSRERRRAIVSAPTPQLPTPGTILSNGVMLEGQIIPDATSATSANEFFGQRAWRPGYQSLEPPDAVTESVGIAGLQAVERSSVDHSSIVIQLLSLAGVHFRKLGSSRMCTRLSWETAIELAHTFEKTQSNANVAMSLLRTVITEYRRDHWTDLLRVALLRVLECPRIPSSGSEKDFDVDCEQELASTCFELAALPGETQIPALNAFGALVTGSELVAGEHARFAKSLVNAWNSHISSALPPENWQPLSLDVSVLGNSGGIVQAWAHFPSAVALLDHIPKISVYVRRAIPTEQQNNKEWRFQVTSVGANLHFYYYHKAKGTSGGVASMTRATTKMADVEAVDLGSSRQLLLEPFSVNSFTCEMNAEDANRVVAAAAEFPSDGNQDQPAEAFVAISGWWIDVLVSDNCNNSKTGKLRLTWKIVDEPAPSTISSSSSLLKLRLRNQPPKWLSSSSSTETIIASSQSTVWLTTSPFLCCLKPRQANVVLSVNQEASPALVGELYPVVVTVKNTNSEVATAEMVLDVTVSSSSPSPSSRMCLLAVEDQEQQNLTDSLTVKIHAIPPSSEQSVKVFIVKQLIPDVLNISLRLRCSQIDSVDHAAVEVVKHSFSLPVIVPLSLTSSNLFDYDTLTPAQPYCPHRRNILSVKVCSSSPHDLDLVSLNLNMDDNRDCLKCAAADEITWPRRLRPGTSFVEVFNLLSISTTSQQPQSTSLGQLVIQWRRSSSGDAPLVKQAIALPEFPVQTTPIIVRTANIPARAVLYKPCVLSFSVKNVTRTTLSLRASVQVPPAPGNSSSAASMLISGPSDNSMTLMSGASISLPISFIPLLSGFMSLPRLRISAVQPVTAPSMAAIDTGAQMNTADITDVVSPNNNVFVQTAPSIEWLLPGTISSTL